MDSRLRGNDEWKGSLAHAKVVKAHPGSESGTCFRTNRSSRLAPAHQGVKSWSCGLIRRIGTADSATPLLRPSGGQAPALHFLIPPSPIGLRLGRIRRWRVGIEVDWRAVAFGQSRGHVTSFSYQSLIPVVAGTPRCENWGALVVEEFESHWHFESAYQSDSGDPSSTPSCRHSAKSEHAYQLYSFWGRPQPVDHLRGGRYEFSN